MRNRLLPIGILLVAMAVTALGILPVPVAFFAAAVLMIFTFGLPLREVYTKLDGPILLMLACLIPVVGFAAHHRRHRSHRQLPLGRRHGPAALCGAWG